MQSIFQRLRNTEASKGRAILRIAGGLPLLIFGIMHLVNPAPFRLILEASGLPFVTLSLVAAPIAEVLAGLLLISGYLSRLGGVLGVATMSTAAYATFVLSGLEQAPEVPPMVLPVAILAISTYILWRGAGSWSFDARTAVARAGESRQYSAAAA